MSAENVAAERARAEHLARAWIDAFNGHNLEQILALYNDDLVLSSEIFVNFSEDKTSTLRGKDKLRRYFGRALARFPDLTFTLQSVFPGMGSVCVLYRTSARDHQACECMTFDQDGRITRVFAHYGR
jgi:ketosteroid isomerase-like protein